MRNADPTKFADSLADVLMKIEDLKLEGKSIIEAAENAGVDAKALRKIAKELMTPPDKLLKKYEEEQQLDIFRTAIDIRGRKGLAK